ncbi:MAG TPA: carboxypeptidase regulatory-like domain-containing protein [Pyrinomonadaceae bacterium]|nr:carboxypeptidase regulatory-like domain-containing protein [Pyrinomonadaceae bacterium]
MKKSSFAISSALMLMAAFFALVFTATPAHAQLTRGTIQGTVKDEAGAAIPGAAVKIINAATSITRDATTDDEGFYRVGALEPGTYTVTIEKSGFSKLENRAVVVQPSLDTTFDAELRAGGVVETIDVTTQAEAIALNKTNPTVGLTVTARQVEELPLGAGRDVNNLALLSPNVFSAPGSTGISANGQRARNNNFTIDGSDNNDLSVTISTTDVVAEAVGEFQIQTNPYSAELGRNSGAQINVITKSGTNDFHGDIYDYYRGSRLNALDNLEKAAGLEKPARFNRNQFGFAIGGPIMIPNFVPGTREQDDDIWAYDGRNRTFFFYLFQGDRTRTGAGLGGTVRIPTPAGFAALQSVPLGPGQSAASRAAVLSRLGFLTTVFGSGAQFRNLTNVTVNGVAIQTGQTNVGISQPADYYTNTLRIDHQLGSNDNLTGRYISNKTVDVNVISNLAFGSEFAGDQAVFDQNLALSETHIFSANVLNEFRFSFIRRNLGFPENDPASPTATIAGLFTVGGLANFPQGRIQNSYQFSDTLSWLAGDHSLKFGVDIRRLQLNNIAAFDSKGTFAFNNFQDFINNRANTFSQALQTASFDARQTQQFYFVQDDWRVTPNLTLNMGLRYETANAPFGFFGATDAESLAALVPGPTRRDNNNFAPAFGFAYSPRPEGGFLRAMFGDGLSSIRGGYRIAYDVMFYNILTVNGSNFPRVVVGQIVSPATQDLYPNVAPTTGAAVFNPLATYVNTPENAVNPYSQLFSLSWQREFARDYVMEIGYTGSRSKNQINQLQANPAVLTAAQIATVQATQNPNSIPSLQARRIFPQFGSRVLIATDSHANYNAGFVTLNKRFTNNLQFGIAYTFSKLISDNDESLGVAAITGGSPQIPQDFFNVQADKSLSAFDRTHRLVANFIYEIPTPGGAFFNEGFGKQVFGGWELSGIIQRQSGQPFTILTGVDTNGNGGGGDRPNFNPNGTLQLDPVTGDFRTFTSPLVGGQFIVPLTTAGTPLVNGLGNGNLGKNTFRAPGFYNTDLSVQKRIFMPWEGHYLIFRSDFLNAFNQDSYGRPVNLLSSPDFGRNLNNWGNRSITLSLKYSF